MSALTVVQSVETPHAHTNGTKVEFCSGVNRHIVTDNVRSPKRRVAHLRIVDASYVEALAARKDTVEPSSFFVKLSPSSTRPKRRPVFPKSREQHHNSKRIDQYSIMNVRCLTLLIGWLFAFVLSIVVGLGIGTLAMPSFTGATETYVVQPGDTLWELSQGVGSDTDIEQTVAQISSMNQLDNTALTPGQTIELPVHPARLQK
ncbi:MAG: LysM peptidoglycan-binding domain-containing protein [Actinomycetaceae bacterium]|nr:LysM peptidoglycan-binding domain-containing protein [Actinomycetaceae bacterium]